MKVRTILQFLTKHNPNVKVYCDDKAYAKNRDKEKDLICFDVRDNGFYLYTRHNTDGVNLYTVVRIYQFNPNPTAKGTKKRKVEIKDYITKNLGVARLHARYIYAKKEQILAKDTIYSYDVEIRAYYSKKDYKIIHFNKKDLE